MAILKTILFMLITTYLSITYTSDIQTMQYFLYFSLLGGLLVAGFELIKYESKSTK